MLLFDTDQRTARETLRFAAGQCVGYREEFVSGDGGTGAYVCSLTITSDGLTMAPGGPGATYVAAAAREYAAPVAAAAALLASADLIKDEDAPWANKPKSGHAYLGSPPVKRRKLQALREMAMQRYGAQITVLQEGNELLELMRSNSIRAAFQASTNTIFVQPGATFYEVNHELKHAKQCALLGVAAYAKQSIPEKELYVYEQLMKEKHLLTSAEITDANRYVNDVLRKHHLSPIA